MLQFGKVEAAFKGRTASVKMGQCSLCRISWFLHRCCPDVTFYAANFVPTICDFPMRVARGESEFTLSCGSLGPKGVGKWVVDVLYKAPLIQKKKSIY